MPPPAPVHRSIKRCLGHLQTPPLTRHQRPSSRTSTSLHSLFSPLLQTSSPSASHLPLQRVCHLSCTVRWSSDSSPRQLHRRTAGRWPISLSPVLPRSSRSASTATPLYPPFASSLPNSEVAACDVPSLNPAHPPLSPPSPGPLSTLHPRPIHHLLIYKKVTTLEEIRRGLKQPADFPYLREDAKVLAADREHQHTIAVVRESVALSGVEWKEVEVIDVSDMAWADCIVCVGGDGTFLKASRHVQETEDVPVVGVNSAPSSSFGFFAAADHHSFPTLLRRLLDGSALVCPLWRARLCVNGVPVGHPVLNEILFCNPIPSATTRYLLTNRGITQLQQSSGIWISTAAGSTGAILGAGGQLMHLSDYRFQYRVRELFSLPITHPRRLEATDFPHIHYNSSSVSSSSPLLTHGLLDADFSFVSRMTTGCLFLDGSVIAMPVQFNDRVGVRRTEKPLQWICPTKEGEGKEQIDHWELVTGLRRARMPEEGEEGILKAEEEKG